MGILFTQAIRLQSPLRVVDIDFTGTFADDGEIRIFNIVF